MGNLVAKSPCKGLLPLSVGAMSASEVETGAMTMLSPRKGQDGALDEAMRAVHGLGYPAPSGVESAGEARAIWFGHSSVLLVGAEPGQRLEEHGVLVDQSDAWAVVRLDGPGAEDVLARLVPVDVRLCAFPVGSTARSKIGHMSGSVTRVGEASFWLMVFRSMAETLVHDLKSAMEAVAARG
ncbi:sarcosine oxidase subunit gamma [Ruegeria marina]|uniref:Sarcosine oxidase subunit gamma n=1 Tax=Ruegeria marina TaxID=639004 RepID=A0A1G6XD78_9RHOB|nr:sarcosine oxidase subunit gamma [Ruegeria marina]SDD75743.1 sarcosine oxidase subunit gamma [Ruegeria marina]